MLKKWLLIDGEKALLRFSDQGHRWLPEKNCIPALIKLREIGFSLAVLVNSENLRYRNEIEDFFASQGVKFERWFESAQIKEMLSFLLKQGNIDFNRTCVVGNLEKNADLANQLGLSFLLFPGDWTPVTCSLVEAPRVARNKRVTKETHIEVEVNLDDALGTQISTGLGYFDHMLEQLSKHSGIGLKLSVKGDLHIDEHHTVEDTALAMGQALREALGDKVGIGRYGFVVPMDEAECRASIDLSGRAFLVFHGKFSREFVGELPTELVEHFFRSFADALGATVHIHVMGENTHHMVESTFKGLGRALRGAVARSGGGELPTTKGIL